MRAERFRRSHAGFQTIDPGSAGSQTSGTMIVKATDKPKSAFNERGTIAVALSSKNFLSKSARNGVPTSITKASTFAPYRRIRHRLLLTRDIVPRLPQIAAADGEHEDRRRELHSLAHTANVA